MPREMTLTVLDDASVRQLAAYTGDPFVLSLYLDVDGRERPIDADWRGALRALLHEARGRGETSGPLPRSALEEDVAAVEGWLGAGVERASTRGLAMFSCARDGFLQAYALPVAVRDEVRVGPRPDVGQLLEALRRARPTVAVLVDSQRARILRVRLGAVDELSSVVDPLERQADTGVELGGWEHRHEEAVRRHLRGVAAEVTRRVDGEGADGVVVGGPAPAVDGLLDLLPERVARLVIGRVPLPVRSVTAEVARAVGELWDRLDEKRRAELVEELVGAIATGHGVSGLAGTLEALEEKRVETLVVGRGYRAPGSRCAACGHMEVGTRDCSWCGGPTDVVENVVDEMVQQALGQRASVEYCDAPAMEVLGHIGALERHR